MSKVIATNRKAYRDYNVIESLECGIELKGSEVKSVRAARVNLEDSFARIEPQGVMLYHVRISPYEEASYLNVEPARTRRLLLHKKQITRLNSQMAQRGFTLVPLKIYFNERGFAKIELAVCRGKRLYDRRQDIKKRESELAIRRAMKHRR
jgi:SsrA-binding protein